MFENQDDYNATREVSGGDRGNPNAMQVLWKRNSSPEGTDLESK
jgi:hypothetical protein